MAAITAAKNRDRLWPVPVIPMDAPLDADAGTVPKGAIVMADSSGYAVNGADTASCRYLGVARETIVVASGGSDGASEIELDTEPIAKYALSGGAAITDVGLPVCISDNDTVAKAGDVTNDVYCGTIFQYIDATYVYVQFSRFGGTWT